MRVTALDGCGRPRNGACASIVSDGFVSVAFTANTDTGTAISVQNAAGKTCISDTPCPTFNGYTVEITFCEVNPLLLAMVSGQAALFDAASGAGNGFTIDSDISACDSGFALELWSNVPGVACDPDVAGAQGSFGYLLVPFLQGGVLGDFTIQNDAVSFVLSGAATKTGSGWDVGPYDVSLDGDGDPAPLPRAIKKGEHLWVQQTAVSPPEPSCDCAPMGTAATNANAGRPGTFDPADGYPPYDLASAATSGMTATPSTAWASDQYIVLGDHTRATWDGTDWVDFEA